MAPEPQVVAEAKIAVPSVPETPSVASLPILPQPSVPPAPKEVADAEITVPVVAASAMATGSLPRSPEPTTPEKSPLAPEARRARAQVEKVEPAVPQTAIIIAETESIKPVAQPAIELATLMPRETTVAPPLKPAEALLPEPIPDPMLAPAPPPLPPQPAPTVSAVPSSEQVASLRVTPADSLTEKKPAPRPVAKALSGFIVQVAFADTRAAQAWAEAMERRGFAVSVTETGETGAVRVRLGNFVARDDAERQLRALRQEGLKGIVINLPQAFRPESTSAAR
jgi:cell division protein FtsN